MKQKIILLISILIGLLAFALTMHYLQSERAKLEKERQAIYEGARRIHVMAARHDIPSGTAIKPSDLGTIEVFESHVKGQAVLPDQAELLFGRRALFTIKAMEPIFWSVVEGGARAGTGLASIVKPGMRAISLSVGGAAAVSAMVRPNDRIDVLGTFSFPAEDDPNEMETVTLTILQDVTVLATGQQTARDQTVRSAPQRSSGYSTVTLEATPREAELLVFAQQLRGRLTLSLRNPADVDFEMDLPSVNFDFLRENLSELNLDRQRNIRHKRNL